MKNLFAIDMRALACFRVVLSLLILFQLLDRALVVNAFYTDQGLLPRIAAISLVKPLDWSIYFLNGSLVITIFFFLTAAFFALLLLVGYRTWLANVLSYLFIVSLQNRNIVIPNGGDYLLRLLVFWSLFLPLGTCYSIDNATRPSSQKNSRSIVSIGAAAFLLQAAFLYLFSGLSKLGLDIWRNGEAIQDALRLEHYGRFLAGTLISIVPPGLYPFLAYATIGIELLSAFLLFSPVFTGPTRVGVIAVLVLMQLTFGLCLEVNLFPFVAIAAMIPFLPPKVWDLVDHFLNQPLFSKFKERFKMPEQSIRQAPNQSVVKLTAIFSNVIAGILLIYVLCVNLEGLTYKSPLYRSVLPRSIIPSAVRWVGDLLELDQAWDMFMPPGKIVYWFVAPGKLKDGNTVDILRAGEPVRWEKPKVFFKNEPWRAYLMNLGGWRKKSLLPYVGPYFCREWNKKYIGEQSLLEFEIFVMSQENPSNDQVGEQYYTSLLKHSCSSV